MLSVALSSVCFDKSQVSFDTFVSFVRAECTCLLAVDKGLVRLACLDQGFKQISAVSKETYAVSKETCY